MIRIIKILTASILIFASGCMENFEVPFQYHDSISIRDVPVMINLLYNQAVNVDGIFDLKFEGVGADSRCPLDVVCVWAGDGEVFLNISQARSSKIYTLHTGLEPREIVINGYLIQLANLFPAPVSTRQIRPGDYNIELRITKMPGSDIQPVQIIDSNYYGLIRKDALSATDISLENDLLNISVGYSGGCKNHLIELFADRAIVKTNPAKVTLYLSHFADGDLCLAYITKKIKFDLTILKSFLKSHYNISDRVILDILDTSGRSVKSGGIEYKF